MTGPPVGQEAIGTCSSHRAHGQTKRLGSVQFFLLSPAEGPSRIAHRVSAYLRDTNKLEFGMFSISSTLKDISQAGDASSQCLAIIYRP